VQDKPIRIVAFVGPSGTGKSTLSWHLIDKFRAMMEIIVSYTTRDLRPTDRRGELEKLHQVIFDLLVEKGFFFAWTVGVHGKQYGTSLASLKKATEGEKICFIIITPDTAEILYKLHPEQTLFFFVWPPGEEELRRRLLTRGDTQESANERIASCRDWAKQSLDSPVPYVYLKNEGSVEDVFSLLENYFV